MTISDACAWYVYAITAGDPALPAMDGILPDSAIDAIPLGPVSVLTSMVPRALFDSADPAQRTSDPDWMAERVAAHHRINLAAATSIASLPLSFGTVFSSLMRIDEWLAPRSAALQTALDQVAGRAEWLVTLTEDAEKHQAWLDEHDQLLCQLREQALSAGDGLGFLLARRRDKARTQARAAHLQAVATEIDQLLALISPDRLAETGRDGMPAWSILACNSCPPIASGIAESKAGTDILAQAGLSLRTTGPWPAYAFARQALAREMVDA
jgi:hypothetical protein